MAGQAPGGQTTPPNINSLAAQGIQGAGMGSAAGVGYAPLSCLLYTSPSPRD